MPYFDGNNSVSVDEDLNSKEKISVNNLKANPLEVSSLANCKKEVIVTIEAITFKNSFS